MLILRVAAPLAVIGDLIALMRYLLDKALVSIGKGLLEGLLISLQSPEFSSVLLLDACHVELMRLRLPQGAMGPGSSRTCPVTC